MYRRSRLCKVFFLIRGIAHKIYSVVPYPVFVSLCPCIYDTSGKATVFPVGKLRGSYYV